MKATRDAFGEVLRELGKENERIVVLDADLSVSTKSALFGKEFPQRFFQMGIAESNMIGVAAGLSFTGYIPFACSFGAFVAGRYETIRVSVGYSKANVKIVGTHAGLGTGEDGYTQMGLEDVGVLRTLPGITILQPCDEVSTHAAVRYAVNTEGAMYLRLTRQKLPSVYSASKGLDILKGQILREGGKVAVLATGGTVGEALSAAEKANGSVWVVDFPTLKPFDKSMVAHLAERCDTFITVEDHNVIGGLGTCVAEALSELGAGAKLVRLGVQDCYGESGLPGELYEKYGISANRIGETIRKFSK